MLTGGALVVLGLAQNSQPPELLVQILHKGGDTGTDGAEIMIIQLLSLRGPGAEEGSSGEPEILPLGIKILGQQEILLLRADAGNHPAGFRISKQPQDPHRLTGNLLHGAQKRCFLVQRFPIVREEAGGDIQAAILDKSKRGGIPGCVASGLKGSPQTARWEGTGIRFAPHKLLSGKLHNHPAVPGGADEGIVFFRRDTCHRLEPMGIVRSALLNCPDLHGFSNFIGGIQRKLRAIGCALLPDQKNPLRKPLLHYRFVKYIAAKNLGYVQNIPHVPMSFP